MDNNFVTRDTYQVNFDNGDIDFISVDDLPFNLSLKFVESKYPNNEIEFLERKIAEGYE